MANEKKTEPVSLEDVSKQIQEMIEEARKEAAKIVAEAKASVNGGKTEEQMKSDEERKAYWNELVEIKLFKDNNKYKDDVMAGVNGVLCQIRRGEKVKVKRKYADLLDKSDIQDYETSMLIEKKSSEFAKTEF